MQGSWRGWSTAWPGALAIALTALFASPMTANTLTDNDQDVMDALSRRGQVLVRDILGSLKGIRPTTSAYDCLNDVAENAERVGNIIEETATLTQISTEMVNSLDESTVNEIIGIIINKNQGILSMIRNGVNYTTGLCLDNTAVEAYSREVVNLVSEYATILRQISGAIGRSRQGSAVRK